MSKVLTPADLASAIERILTDPKSLGIANWDEAGSPLPDILEDLARKLCRHLDGFVATVSGPDFTRAEAEKAGIETEGAQCDWCVHIHGHTGVKNPRRHWTSGFDKEGELFGMSLEEYRGLEEKFGWGLYANLNEGGREEINPWPADPQRQLEHQHDCWKDFWRRLLDGDARVWWALRHLQESSPAEVYRMREYCTGPAQMPDIPEISEWVFSALRRVTVKLQRGLESLPYDDPEIIRPAYPAPGNVGFEYLGGAVETEKWVVWMAIPGVQGSYATTYASKPFGDHVLDYAGYTYLVHVEPEDE